MKYKYIDKRPTGIITQPRNQFKSLNTFERSHDYIYNKTGPVVQEKIFKEVGPRTAKLALLLIKFMKCGVLQFLLFKYLEESPNSVHIPNIHR